MGFLNLSCLFFSYARVAGSFLRGGGEYEEERERESERKKCYDYD